MATSLCSAVLLAALLQAPGGPPAAAGPPLPDSAAASSLPALRARLARDSSDGGAWLLLGRLYLELADDAHGRPHRVLEDSVALRALLEPGEDALGRAGQLLAPAGWTPDGDSARVLRVGAWGARSRLAWEVRGSTSAPKSGGRSLSTSSCPRSWRSWARTCCAPAPRGACCSPQTKPIPTPPGTCGSLGACARTF